MKKREKQKQTQSSSSEKEESLSTPLVELPSQTSFGSKADEQFNKKVAHENQKGEVSGTAEHNDENKINDAVDGRSSIVDRNSLNVASAPSIIDMSTEPTAIVVTPASFVSISQGKNDDPLTNTPIQKRASVTSETLKKRGTLHGSFSSLEKSTNSLRKLEMAARKKTRFILGALDDENEEDGDEDDNYYYKKQEKKLPQQHRRRHHQQQPPQHQPQKRDQDFPLYDQDLFRASSSQVPHLDPRRKTLHRHIGNTSAPVTPPMEDWNSKSKLNGGQKRLLTQESRNVSLSESLGRLGQRRTAELPSFTHHQRSRSFLYRKPIPSKQRWQEKGRAKKYPQVAPPQQYCQQQQRDYASENEEEDENGTDQQDNVNGHFKDPPRPRYPNHFHHQQQQHQQQQQHDEQSHLQVPAQRKAKNSHRDEGLTMSIDKTKSNKGTENRAGPSSNIPKNYSFSSMHGRPRKNIFSPAERPSAPRKQFQIEFDSDFCETEEEHNSSSTETEGSESYDSSSYDEQSYTSHSEDEEQIVLHLPRNATYHDFTIQNVHKLCDELRIDEKDKERMPSVMSAYQLNEYFTNLDSETKPNVVFKFDVDAEEECEFEIHHIHRERIHRGKQRRHRRRHHAKKLIKAPVYRTITERKATWLELFYDLFFVGVIAEISHFSDINIKNTAKFIGLFLPIWWVWCHQALYANRFDSDDLVYRLTSLVQMFALVVVALNVPHAYDIQMKQFDIGFIILWITLLFQYTLVTIFERKARIVSLQYVATFFIHVLLWSLSLIWSQGYVLWYVSIGLDFSFNYLLFSKFSEKIPFSASHLPERFGLFSIIVHGEFVLGLISAALDTPLSVEIYGICALGIITVFCMWWIYYDDFDGSIVSNTSFLSNLWILIHLPLHMVIAYVGLVFRVLIVEAGKNEEVEKTKDYFVISCSIMFSLNACLKFISCNYSIDRYYLIVYISRISTSAAFLICFPLKLSTIALLSICASLASLQVVTDVLVQHLVYLEEVKLQEGASIVSNVSSDTTSTVNPHSNEDNYYNHEENLINYLNTDDITNVSLTSITPHHIVKP